jgi:hypothetical protein
MPDEQTILSMRNLVDGMLQSTRDIANPLYRRLKIHYAWSFDEKTLCNKQMILIKDYDLIKYPRVLHTTNTSKVTCKNCRKKLDKCWLIKEEEI